MNQAFVLMRGFFLTTFFLLLSPWLFAQKLLDKRISISAKDKPVSDVLRMVGESGKFSFSYNSDILPGDSLVSVTVRSKSVRQILEVILPSGYQFKESADYVIIQRTAKEKYYYLTGHILDNDTGKEVDYASIYNKEQLTSALSDDGGNFRLRLRERSFPFLLFISKVGYADTSIVVNSEKAEIRVVMYPKAVDLDPLVIKYSDGGNSWLTRAFLSSKLRMQSQNISRFFVALPFQASFTPGLSTQGRMSSQVINKFSLNIMGGYTAGVNGVELAGLFNISKKDVKYVQIAGIFNVVYGKVTGVQMAGLHSHVMNSVSGVQLSGFSNMVNGDLEGVQMSGILNRTTGNLRGVQMASRSNITKGDFSGTQVAGLVNIGRKEVKGVQIAGIVNYAKVLRGVQVGMINLADSSSGYSIGLLNIVKKGKGSLSLYANELVPVNFAWKSGSKRLYNIFALGASGGNQKAYTFGFGLGTEFSLTRNVTMHVEFVNQTVYLGTWHDVPSVNRFQTGLNLKLSKRLSLSAGPSFSMFDNRAKEPVKGYQTFDDKGFFNFNMNRHTKAWIGWQGGLTWNYGGQF